MSNTYLHTMGVMLGAFVRAAFAVMLVVLVVCVPTA